MRSLPGGVRFVAAVLAGLACATLLGLAVGWAAGDRAARGIAIAYYIIGGLVAIVGVAGGLRGAFRPAREGGFFPTGVRRVDQAELHESMASAALLIGLGVATLIAAAVVDPSARVL